MSDSSDDILFAYESSPGFKGNNIVMRQYTSLDAMIANNFTDKLNITRSLGAINEGTPSFDNVDFSGKLTTSNFTLRLHFYKNSQHDQQAIGHYKDGNWSAHEEKAVNILV